jgi:hypothetical protein
MKAVAVVAHFFVAVVASDSDVKESMSLLQTSSAKHTAGTLHGVKGREECKAAKEDQRSKKAALKAARASMKIAKAAFKASQETTAAACPEKTEVKEGMCSGQPAGAPCSLGDLSDSFFSNPSFEDYSECPTKDSQLPLADDWSNPTSSTPDLWVNSCPAPRNNRLAITLPQAFDGNAMIGLAKTNGGDFTEYCGGCLSTPIVKGRDYTFSFAMTATALTGPGGAKWGGDIDGKTDLLCLPSCDIFPIAGTDNKADTYPILAQAQPGETVKQGAGWSQVTFAFTAENDCPAIMFGFSKDSTNSGGGFTGTYALYDGLALHEGSGGQCNANGQCIGKK